MHYAAASLCSGGEKSKHLPPLHQLPAKKEGSHMKLNKVEMGIHTIELYTGALKYSETQKVIDYVTDKGSDSNTQF